MKKKFLSVVLAAMISVTALISCGNNEKSQNETPNNSVTTEENTDSQNSEANLENNDTVSENPNIVGENNKPTANVTQIATISDFKDKSKSDIEGILGKPITEDDTHATYEKDDYTFEITYLNSKANEIKITPKNEMKFPADGTNILKLVGINASTDTGSLSPAGIEWDDKYDTYKINVVSNNEPDGKISYVNIILSDPSK